MKKLITVLLLLVSNLVFAALTYTQQTDLNNAFQILKDNGVNPTIMETTLENVQMFSNPANIIPNPSVNFNVNFSGGLPGTTTWMPVIQQNILDSVINSGDYTFSIGTHDPVNYTVNIVNDKTGNLNHDLFKININSSFVNGGPGFNYYNLSLGQSSGGNARESFGYCTSNNTSTDKKCIKNALNRGYKSIVNRSDDMFFSNALITDIGDMVGGGIKEGIVDVKSGMQSMTYLTASSILGQTARDICTPGDITAICNVVGQKFEIYNNKVTSLDITGEDYNLGLDNLLNLSDALFQIDAIKLDYESPQNGMLLLGDVQWYLLD